MAHKSDEKKQPGQAPKGGCEARAQVLGVEVDTPYGCPLEKESTRPPSPRRYLRPNGRLSAGWRMGRDAERVACRRVRRRAPFLSGLREDVRRRHVWGSWDTGQPQTHLYLLGNVSRLWGGRGDADLPLMAPT